MGNCCRKSGHDDIFHEEELRQSNFKTQTYEKLSKFTFDGLLTKAKVIDVLDGDTITLVFYWHDSPVKDSFRMFGYDSPEIKPKKTISFHDKHVTAAKVVHDYLRSLILGHIVWVQFCKEEKYGRLMSHIYIPSPTHEAIFKGDEININQLMLSQGYGISYDGGHKSEFNEQQLDQIIDQGSNLGKSNT